MMNAGQEPAPVERQQCGKNDVKNRLIDLQGLVQHVMAHSDGGAILLPRIWKVTDSVRSVPLGIAAVM
jgi:hypothetical protein